MRRLAPSEGAVWLAVLVTLAGLLGLGGAMVARAVGGPGPPAGAVAGEAGAVAGEAGAVAGEARTGPLELAGSGSNLPLTRKLAEAWRARGGEAVTVHESIGSGGAVLAVLDGAVDVGLLSRELTAAERAKGLVATPYARVPVVVAAHPDVPDAGLTRAGLLALYGGERRRWADGTEAVVLQRERGDSSHAAVAAAWPAFGAVDEASRRAGRFEVLFRDVDMQRALLEVPGAVGLFDLGAIVAQGLPIRALVLDGVDPRPAAGRDGAWPFSKPLAFLTLGPPAGRAARFIAFSRSAEAARLAEAAGYLPVPGAAGPTAPEPAP